jgi:hypothetical protein
MLIRLFLPNLFILSILVCTAGAQEACVTNINGEVVCAPQGGVCIRNTEGNVVCSKAGGSVIQNNWGDLVCGPGQCIKDGFGRIFCSAKPYGGAAFSGGGEPVCVGGCVEGSVSYCAIS